MADSLFDNRYRYDYIYPRGRSGETLRAVDTESRNRPVVIKRPAPNDAPPIRAGQEVSILNERRALTRLAGHPILTELLGGGQFTVGGVTHQYIVMERAEGLIIEDIVLNLAQRGERLPELEMLIVIDALIDLLAAAHEHDIVYNDVDAKHLFWSRENYRLKLIDWGNAVFLEGDEITPQGVSRQSDIFQVGELLFFIVSGGGRADIPRTADEDFRLDFGKDSESIHSRLQAIISRAVHPNPRLRYATLADLRTDLADYRVPLERERNSILARVAERLRRDRSKDELSSLLKALEPAIDMDPGYPEAQAIQRQIVDRLGELAIAADLDAARIYLESGNWARATDLLDELREQASEGESSTLILLLSDWARLLRDANPQPVANAVFDAFGLIFDRQNPAGAARILLTRDVADSEMYRLQLLMAERVSAHLPEVLLLRPNLYRLEVALGQLMDEDIAVTEPRALLTEILSQLESIPSDDDVTLGELRDRFRVVVDGLTALNTLLEAVNATYQLPNRRLPFSALVRALNAAMALADNMHVIGKQTTSSPRDALAALDSSRAIDPTNPAWEAVSRLLESLYERLNEYQTFTPSADGSDMIRWLQTAQRELDPFVGRLFDEMLADIIEGLEHAEAHWESFAAATTQGNREGATTALSNMIDAVNTVSPSLGSWLAQLRSVVESAAYIERHTLYGGLGRALADGWENFDRGRLVEAARLGEQAYEIARTDAERSAARRLRDLSEAARGWTERTLINDADATRKTLNTVEKLYTVEENEIREQFARQMPSKDTYLRAMGKGLIDIYAARSTTALRVLYFNYVLLGAFDAHDAELEDTDFWREAAQKTLDVDAHPLLEALDDFLERRRNLEAGAELLNQVNGTHALPVLETTRQQLEENPEARALAAALHSLRELEAALRDWSDGEFRVAGSKLENGLAALDEVEQQAAVTLTGYRAFLMDLIAGTAELYSCLNQIQQIVRSEPANPPTQLRSLHAKLVDTTMQLIGEAYAGNVRLWQQSYADFLDTYTDPNMRRSMKLNRFNELFRAMFIDRHPCYPLYRHWYTLTEQASEFPAPPTDEPTPRLTEEASEYAGSRYADDGSGKRRRFPTLVLMGGIIAVLIVAGLFVFGGLNPPTVSNNGAEGNNDGAASGADSIVADATAAVTAERSAEAETVADDEADAATLTPSASATERGTAVPLGPTASLVATDLPLVANESQTTTTATSAPTATESATPTPSFTPSATATATITSTPTPTETTTRTPLPPEGAQGDQDVLQMLNQISSFPWEPEQFSPAPDAVSWRLGIGADVVSTNPTINVFPQASTLELFYGNDAASRLRRTEATLTLTTFNPELLAADEDIYFGVLLQSADSPMEQVGINIQLPQPGVINLGQRSGTSVQTVSQRSVSTIVADIRLERDPNTGAVNVFYNNEQIGDPLPFVAADAPVIPVLFVRNGGVIVNVTEWSINLR